MTTLNRRELRALLGGGSVGYSYDGSGYGEAAYDGNAHGFIPAGGGYADDEEVVGFTQITDLSSGIAEFDNRLENFSAAVESSPLAMRSTAAFSNFYIPFSNHRSQWRAWKDAHQTTETHDALAGAELSIFGGKQGIFEQEYANLPASVPQNAPLPSGEVTLDPVIITGTKPSGGGAAPQPSGGGPLVATSSAGGGLSPNTIMKAGAGIAIVGALALAFSGGKGRGRR